MAAHFGSPFREQRSFAQAHALLDLSQNGVLRITGPDRLAWLDSMTSQRLSQLAPGESAETLLLDPQGHIESVIRVIDVNDRTWLLVDDGVAEPLTEFLNRMRFTLRVEVENVGDSYQAVGLFLGGAAERVVETLAGDETPAALWIDPWQNTLAGGWQYATASDHPAADWNYAEAVVHRDAVAALAAAISRGECEPAGMLAFEALRIAAWRPAQHTEVDDRALPHEFDWMRSAVHLDKGCYRGQETVAKVHNLGHPPRRLTLLHLDGSDAILPQRGELVYVAGDDAPVGRITSAARHMEWGAIALALLKRSVDVDASLEVATEGTRVPASQEIIVPPEAGATRQVPKLPRL